MGRYPARLRRAGISPARLMELKGLCRQYREMQRRLRLARAGVVDREPGSGAWSRPDPTGGEALRLAMHPDARRVKIIEDAAAAVAEPLVAAALIRSVADGESYWKIGPPMGERQFYILRQLFFIELDKRV